VNPENKFKVGDYARERRVYFDNNQRDSRQGQVCEIIESTAENGYSCDEVMIIMDNLETYSDFFYVFEFDKEKYRENKIDNLLM
jgi:hypothetical protein